GEHVSLYQLTIEPETPYAQLHAAGKLPVPDEDTARALFEATQEICAAQGLPAYEISNHARPGGECRHNLIYWRGHEYRSEEYTSELQSLTNIECRLLLEKN